VYRYENVQTTVGAWATVWGDIHRCGEGDSMVEAALQVYLTSYVLLLAFDYFRNVRLHKS